MTIQKGLLSIVIPSKNEIFLSKTIQDICSKAKGDIEVIAVLDNYWPVEQKRQYWQTPAIIDDKRVIYLLIGRDTGMRGCINAGVSVARGEFVYKLDAHCLLDEGFDLKLKADCNDNWVVVSRRKRLDAEKWEIQEVGKPDVDYMYLSYPDNQGDFGGPGLHGRNWDDLNRRDDLTVKEIDDLMSFQGSGWFMKRDYFYFLELMDEEHYGSFPHEAQEIGLKCWLSGGRVVVNKKTWYAHLHKGKTYGRGYFLDKRVLERGTVYTNRWVKERLFSKQIYDFKWLIDKFAPVPGWEKHDWSKPFNL